jgi:hypothetical protein
MTTRHAVCNYGQLRLTIEGEPSRISMCHCLECQRRTGAVTSNQARFRREQLTFAGKATAWMRTAESGNALTFHFCPTCGSAVYWEGVPMIRSAAAAMKPSVGVGIARNGDLLPLQMLARQSGLAYRHV